MSSLSPSSSDTSTASSTPASGFPTFFPTPPSGFPGPPLQTGNPNTFNNNNNNNNNNGNGSGLATSASLYLYTFLATLVLLLSVSAAIVIRSYLLRRRQRLAMEEAIRNGTWMPPAPPFRTPRVDLSKKPGLWEVYLSGSRSGQVWLSEKGNTKGIGPEWREENSRDWESIKPFSAAITTTAPSDASISPSSNSYQGVEIPVPVPGIAANNLPAPNTASSASSPPHRTLLDRARELLGPISTPLPGPSNDTTTPGLNTDLAMTELRLGATSDQPQIMRVAVFIAMPSPHSGLSSSKLFTRSASGASVTSANPFASSSSLPNLQQQRSARDNDQPLPHLEMGVADVLVHHPESDPSRSMQRKSRMSEISEFDSP